MARQQAETIKPGGDRRSETARIKRDDVTLDTEGRGTSSTYLLRRLARSSPETLAAYEAGRFPSVRAAAREAGGWCENVTPG